MDKLYTLGLYEKAMPKELTWKEKLTAAKEAGFDYVEISIDETEEKLARLDMGKQQRLKLVETMYEAGIPIRSMCLSGHRKYPLGSNDPKICEKGMNIMEKAIQLADDLGVRIIQIAGYDVYYEKESEETKRRFSHNLQRAVEMAAKAGVLMGFETMETEFMNTTGKAMKHVIEEQSPYLNIYPDSGNIMNASVIYGTDVFEDLKSGAGHIVSVHLKETVPGKFREIPFGSGHVDFQKMIETAWKLGVRKYVTEFWYCGNPDWKQDLLFANRMMTRYLDEQQSVCGNRKTE